MSKAFTKESDGDDEDDLPDEIGGLPAGAKNYMTPQGFERMREELMTLMRKERPEVVQVVSLGGRQRRPLGERRLSLRQEAAARDRPPHPVPQQAAGTLRGRRPGQAAQDRPGVLRRHRDLRQREGRGTHGQDRRRRRGRPPGRGHVELDLAHRPRRHARPRRRRRADEHARRRGRARDFVKVEYGSSGMRSAGPNRPTEASRSEA